MGIGVRGSFYQGGASIVLLDHLEDTNVASYFLGFEDQQTLKDISLSNRCEVRLSCLDLVILNF